MHQRSHKNIHARNCLFILCVVNASSQIHIMEVGSKEIIYNNKNKEKEVLLHTNPHTDKAAAQTHTTAHLLFVLASSLVRA